MKKARDAALQVIGMFPENNMSWINSFELGPEGCKVMLPLPTLKCRIEKLL
jgi:hypothetical protein